MNYLYIINSLFFISWTIERIYYYKFINKNFKAIYHPISMPKMNNTTNINSTEIDETNYILPNNTTNTDSTEIPETNYILQDNTTNL